MLVEDSGGCRKRRVLAQALHPSVKVCLNVSRKTGQVPLMASGSADGETVKIPVVVPAGDRQDPVLVPCR